MRPAPPLLPRDMPTLPGSAIAELDRVYQLLLHSDFLCPRDWNDYLELLAHVIDSTGLDWHSPRSWVSAAQGAEQDDTDFNARVARAESTIDVASSNYVLGYNASDAWAGAAQYLSPLD